MTHLELLQQLPSPYREQAIENNSEKYLNESTYVNIENVLLFGFTWKHSPQLDEYWRLFYQRAQTGEFGKPKDPSVTLPMELWQELLPIIHGYDSSYAELIESQLNTKP